MTSASLLESVASHEQGLMVQVREAEARAHEIIEQAHADAAAHAARERARTEDEIARKRREAAAAREQVEVEVKQAGQARVAEVRASAQAGIEEVTQEILQQVLPARHGGNAA